MKLVEHGENGTVEINDFQTQRTEIDEDGGEHHAGFVVAKDFPA